MSVSHKQHTDHQERAAEARKTPGAWVSVAVYPSRQSAQGITSLIRSGRLAAYTPAGSFEATVTAVADGTEVLALYLGTAIRPKARQKKTVPTPRGVPGGMFADAVAFLGDLLADGAPLTATVAAGLLAEAGHDVAAEVVRAYMAGTSTKGRMLARTAARYLVDRDMQRAAAGRSL